MKTSAMIVAMGMTVCVAHAQFLSVPGPDASDMWMRNQLMNNMNVNVSVPPPPAPSSSSEDLGSEDSGNSGGSSNDIDESFNAMKAAYAALERGDWETGLRKMEWLGDRNSSLEAPINRASYYLTASMCAWNLGRKSSALRLLDRAISIMRNGANMGGGCEARAVAFRTKMQEGGLPSHFTSADMQYGVGIHDFIMEIPKAKWNRNIQNSIAKYEAIGGRADAQRGIYEAHGRWFEKVAKFYARQEYQDATGRSFDPDRPPVYGTSDRDYWNAAKRVYDIFGE